MRWNGWGAWICSLGRCMLRRLYFCPTNHPDSVINVKLEFGEGEGKEIIRFDNV